jgi:hypothetical protein
MQNRIHYRGVSNPPYSCCNGRYKTRTCDLHDVNVAL